MSADSPKKEVFSFPCPISLKVIGKDENDYRQFVLETVKKHVMDLDLDQIRAKPSRGDNFLSVTVPFIAQNREQLNAIYEQLGQDERTRLVL